MSLAAIVVALFLLVYAALALIALRRPLLRRLALREAIRRPGQAVLIVLGLMVGTTAIYAMQLMADSAVQSDAAASYKAWGHVDLVADDGGRFFDPAVASGIAADPRVTSSTIGVQAGVELQGSVIDLDRNNAKPLVMLVGFDPATQKPFGGYMLRDGRTTIGQELASGEVLLSASLADSLEAQIGDRLRVAASPDQTAELRVAGIAVATGPGAYGLRPAVFAPLASMRLVTGRPEINVIRVGAAGEGRAEIDRAHDAVKPLRTALAVLSGGGNLRVREAKRDDVEAALANASISGSFFTTLGLLVALAGVTLVVILALGLAEERRPRHAVLRALGLTRSGLVTLLVLEGATYSAIAALLAPISGALMGLGIVEFLAHLYRSDPAGVWATQLQPTVDPGSVVAAAAAGGLITIGTLVATSFRSSRMQISSAVKNLPDPTPVRGRSTWRVAAIGVLGLAAAIAVVAGTSPARLAGGSVLILVAALVARGRLSPRVLATLAGAALAVWTGAAAAAENPLNTLNGFLILAMASPIAVFGLSLALASNLPLLATAAGRLSGRAKATLTPSLAYLARRPLRAGLGTGAFGLVLTLLTLVVMVMPSTERAGVQGLDEYDIRVTALAQPGLKLPDSVRSQIARDVTLRTRPYVGTVHVKSGGLEANRPAEYLPLYALTHEQLLAAPFQLVARDSRFRTDGDVWQALASDPSLILSPNYQVLGGELTLIAPNGPIRFRIAGVPATLGLFGLVGSEAAMAPFTTLPVGTTILARSASGSDPRAVARQIQREVFSQGGEATTIQETLDALAEGGRAISNTLSLGLGIGLLVGVLSLGILALRAVVERRRSIGVLRALGFGPPNVLAGMLLEALITATSGALIGTGVGVLMGFLLLRSMVGPANVRVEGFTLAWTLALMYVAVVAVTLGPAVRAARLAPSEALRAVD